MAGYDPWHTATGGGAALSIATIGSTPTDEGASINAGVLTLQPADATHGGVIAASGSQTIAPAMTFPGGINTGGASVVMSGGSQLDVRVAGNFLTTSNGPYGTYSMKGGTGVCLNIIAAVAGDTVSLPANSGFPFPTTLAPSGTTQTVNWMTGASQTIDAASTTGTLVLTFANPVNGGRYILKTLGKTGRIWTMPTSLWAGGVKPTVTATDGAIDLFQFIYDGTNYIGSVIAQNVS